MATHSINASQVSQVSLAQFAGAAQQVGGHAVQQFENGTIELKGKTYQVSIQGSQVSVTREGGVLKNLFSRNYAGQLQAKLQREMGEALQTQAETYQSAMRSRILEVRNRDTVGTHFQGLGGATRPDVEMASYGFEDVRGNASRGIAEYNQGTDATVQVRLTKIDQYNKHLGVTWASAGTTGLPGILSDLRGGTLAWAPDVGSPVRQEDAEAWRTFLQGKAGKLDIFARIRDMEAAATQPAPPGAKQSGWQHEARTKGADAAIQAFVRKNTPPYLNDKMGAAEVRTVARLLREFSHLVGDSPGGVPSQEAIGEFQARMANDPEMSDTVFLAFEDVAKTAFFRQTSKLGLEFFQSRGVPVLFQWTDSKGVDFASDKAQGAHDKGQKWWHDLGTPVTGHFAPVTFSEMRHVERLQARTDGGLTLLQVKPREPSP